jgi:putative ABC transport system permease protein
MAYRLMYELKDIKYILNWKLACVSLVVALVCSMGTTWLTCRYELKETAASLMRPKAPKAGKRIILERIPWIWKRLKFLQKVSARNIFRYKKRFFMMVVGISGCTALLLTGFGIKDSIADFADQQYEDIQIYDGSFTLADGDASTDRALLQSLQDNTQTYTLASESTWDVVNASQVKSITLLIFSEPDQISDYMCLNTADGQAISYPGTGEAVISDGIAKNLNIAVGDLVVLRDSNMQEIEVTITGIFENHVYNYILLSPETYEEQLETEPEYKVIYVNFDSDVDQYAASAEIMKQDDVVSVTLNQDTKERMANIMKNLNYVVLLVIICAAALAFIVLYNLVNINITERIREIATIKVLGFFKNETASYVFRENIILTGLGILVGLILGVFLHRFVMSQINVDLVSFAVYIRPISYLFSIVLTFAFNFAINQVMSVKLDKINMAESLKSVD